VLSRPSRLLDRRLPLYHGQSLLPVSTSHRTRHCFTRHQRGFTQFTRPVFPSPAAAQMERAAASAFPRASHPADQEPTTHVEDGTGQRARTWNYSLNITSVDPPIVVHSQRATSRRTTNRSSAAGGPKLRNRCRIEAIGAAPAAGEADRHAAAAAPRDGDYRDGAGDGGAPVVLAAADDSTARRRTEPACSRSPTAGVEPARVRSEGCARQVWSLRASAVEPARMGAWRS
jgi:hypothetical protein